jgi:hypothetical protein
VNRYNLALFLLTLAVAPLFYLSGWLSVVAAVAIYCLLARLANRDLDRQRGRPWPAADRLSSDGWTPQVMTCGGAGRNFANVRNGSKADIRPSGILSPLIRCCAAFYSLLLVHHFPAPAWENSAGQGPKTAGSPHVTGQESAQESLQFPVNRHRTGNFADGDEFADDCFHRHSVRELCPRQFKHVSRSRV